MWAWLLFAGAWVVLLIRWRRSDLSLSGFIGFGLFRAYARLWHGVVPHGTAFLPKKGPIILVANHTCSPDGAFLASGCPQPVSFVVAREYSTNRLLDYLAKRNACVLVRRGGADPTAVRRALRCLSEGHILCIFPEGGLSYAGRPKRGRGKAGAALLALRSRAPVIPAHISRGPQTDDLGRAWLCPSRARVTFGPAVDLTAYYDRPITRKLLEEVTALMMRQVLQLDAAHRTRRFP